MMTVRQKWHQLRASFWFVPVLLVTAAVLLAFVLIFVETRMADDALDRWPLLFGASASGARGLLTTVASSMITLAGVVFSITLVALTLASSQYTSRVLRNFMRDRINQTVLGVFVGIFAYCLVVLRTIRGGEEEAFDPSLAVLMGLILALVGIFILIYFIHHMATSIQASHILASAADETMRAIDRLFPDELDPDEEAPALDHQQPEQAWVSVQAAQTGYVQSVEMDALVRFAQKHKTVVRMERGLGEFIIEGMPLISVLGGQHLDDEQRDDVRDVFAIGRQRSVEQDAAFGIRQIVDVALKALSPGINDTTTAVMCINYLTAILVRLSSRRITSLRHDDDGALRVLGLKLTYAGFVGTSFDEIRQSADGNITVILRLLEALDLLTTYAVQPARRQVLLTHARAVAEMGRRTVDAPVDHQRIDEAARRLLQRFEHRDEIVDPLQGRERHPQGEAQ